MVAAPDPRNIPALDVPVETLAGVGERTREKLLQLGVRRVCDLLFLLPLRYLDRTRLTAIVDAASESEVLIEGEIRAAQVQYHRRRNLMVRIEDATGTMLLRYFHFNYHWQRRFTLGMKLRCFGIVRCSAIGHPEMIHPQSESFAPGESPPLDTCLTPVYPSAMQLSQFQIRRWVGVALVRMQSAPLPDYLEDLFDEDHALPGLCAALEQVHAPLPGTQTDVARRRLALEELLAHRIALLNLRRRRRQYAAPELLHDGTSLRRSFIQQLPFELTAAQQRCCDEICKDLMGDAPMTRLLQGDVGTGKTVVAVTAAMQIIGGGGQAALMVPTELLAQQHYERLCRWLAELDVSVALQIGGTKKSIRRRNQARFEDGTPLLAVGTHALIQENVSFAHLGLAIIDEQHRFGVCQRLELLREEGGRTRPHQLVMTATPIPRTLYMALYAGLETSVIDELPPGRRPVRTVVVDADRRDTLVTRIREACSGGRQAYWVCGLIEDSASKERQSVTGIAAYLRARLPELAIGVIHGRLKTTQKEKVMHAFQAGELDLLVATTVIEVGIDVKNASLMVIENSDHLGLSQLHQLRGRIGRGDSGGDCVLLYTTPLSELARARLHVMRTYQDGFRIATEDLRLRGPGEILGEQQTGLPRFRIADLGRDAALFPQLEGPGERLLEVYPERVAPLLERWLDTHREYTHV